MTGSDATLIAQQHLDVIIQLTAVTSKGVGQIAIDVAQVADDVHAIRLDQEGKTANFMYTILD